MTQREEELEEILDNLRIAWEDIKHYLDYGKSDRTGDISPKYVVDRMREWEKEFKGQFERK